MASMRRDIAHVLLYTSLGAPAHANGPRLTLLDTQFITAHLTRFGAIEIPRERYLLKLQDALNREALWVRPG